MRTINSIGFGTFCKRDTLDTAQGRYLSFLVESTERNSSGVQESSFLYIGSEEFPAELFAVPQR